MAPSFRRNKFLVCFYCNKRSNIKYDGLITRWDCTQCESTNFLDENGEITDPPVATDSAATSFLRYNTAPVTSLSYGDDNQLFCSTCVKNQHLYTASLAQYHVETDPSHPQYKEMEREYFAYRKNLERLYPQVCRDCEPKVLSRLRDAGKTAKADHLRRAMDRSRAKRFSSQSNFSFSGTIVVLGKWVWYIGLAGQLFWALFPILSLVDNHGRLNFSSESALVANLNTVARISLSCSILSIWWNPMFKEMNKGFMAHISGFGNWYKLQFLSILVRLLFYNTLRPSISNNPFSSTSIGANSFIVIFTSMLAIMSHRSLKIDMTPLWTATPEKLSVTSKNSDSHQKSETMADILEEMMSTPSRSSSRPVSSPRMNGSGLQSEKKSQSSNMFSPLSISSWKIDSEPTNSMMVGRSQAELNIPSVVGQSQQDSYEEEMEWTPTESQSQHRAFNSPQSSQRTDQSFGHTPMVDQPSPFWYKVPPAPTTPAQRLRNPPNQPALRVASQVEKENFFNRVTQRQSTTSTLQSREPVFGGNNSDPNNAFAQQKFFLPPPPNEVGNSLADLLTGFSLGNTEQEVLKGQVEDKFWKRNLIHSFILLLCLGCWNLATSYPTEQSYSPILAIPLLWTAVGWSNLLNSTKFQGKRSPLAQATGTITGIFECVVSVYWLTRVANEQCQEDSCASLGMILSGGMLLFEVLTTIINI